MLRKESSMESHLELNNTRTTIPNTNVNDIQQIHVQHNSKESAKEESLQSTNKKGESSPDYKITLLDLNKIHNTLRSTPILNEFNSTFPLNVEDACTRHAVHTFIPKMSSVEFIKRRLIVRMMNQRKYSHEEKNKAQYLFFVGLPRKRFKNSVRKKIARKLEKEYNTYGDIVQINIEDVDDKIVPKTIAVLQRINTFCANSQLIIKTDDNVIL